MPSSRQGRRPDQLPPGRHGLPRRVVLSSQRSRIVRAMTEAVAEEGYVATRVADVIVRAGVSRRTFYEHFADKDECFLATYDEFLTAAMEATGQAYEREDAWTDQIRSGLGAFLAFLASEPAAAKMCVVDVLAAGPAALERRENAIRGFTYFIDAGRAQGPRGLPGFTALVVLGGINEVLYTQILHGQARQLPTLLPDLVYCIVLPFLGADRARAESERARLYVDELLAVAEERAAGGQGTGGGG